MRDGEQQRPAIKTNTHGASRDAVCLFVEQRRKKTLGRRPDAAEKGNNVALIVFHGILKGSSATAASERVTFIQRKPRAALAAAAPLSCSQIGFGGNQQLANFKMTPSGRPH
jgi:hypothetical protein